MCASMITGEDPVAPNAGPASDCPRKSIRHRRRRCDPTIRSSLCAPETIPTTLTQRFCCSICFHCMRQGGFCQEYSAKKFSTGRPACQAFYILTESGGRGMLTDREGPKSGEKRMEKPMSITRAPFGALPDGRPVERITLEGRKTACHARRFHLRVEGSGWARPDHRRVGGTGGR